MRSLRPYQTAAKTATFEAFASDVSTLVCLPTGTGKTTFAGSFTKDWLAAKGGRAMVLIHMEEQVQQWKEELEAFGLTVGVEKADREVDEDSMFRPEVVISSVPTIRRSSRRAKFDADQFTLVVADEGHHGTAPSWRETRGYFATNPACRIMYLTATPRRGDGVALSSVCDGVAYHYDLVTAIDDGWLVPVHSKVVAVQSLDFSWMDTVRGDLHPGQLQKELTEKVSHLHAVALPTLDTAGDAPCLVYCSGLDHAQKMADTLNKYKPTSAIHLSGSTPKEERRQWVSWFLEGRLQFLCVFGLFLEAFNAPKVKTIVMARPTKNPALYEQMLGRGTRTYPGTLDGLEDATPAVRREAIAGSAKPHMLVLDFAGNSGKHHLCRSTDLLGGQYGERVREYAKSLNESSTAVRPTKELLEQALAEIALMEEEEQRTQQLQARAQYRLRDVDPFGSRHGTAGQAMSKPKLPATPKQVARLVGLGVKQEFAVACDRKKAQAIIHRLMFPKSKKRRA